MKKLLALFVLLMLAPASINTSDGGASALQEKGRVRAPELVGHRGWLNTEGALSLAQLRGKVVLLDFWTYGCINCVHIIPDLKRLEEKYANQLVVIGVHSAKFDNERETENIRRIILRYGVEHPVVNDADFKIWNSYAVRAWPTQVLIDPAGYVRGSVAGEGHYETLDRAIGQLVEDFRARGALNEEPFSSALERAKVGDLPLAFPGKILADARSKRLFISDSNHNRIVVTRLDGTLVETIGTGAEGADDGAFDKATFKSPQGLALDGDELYVCDTSNHLIRAVNLRERRVRTLAGTGRQARKFSNARMSRPNEVALASPWDIHVAGVGEKKSLYIAMAGPHQIWSLNERARDIGPYAGSGREERTDGELLEAGFAQPSGLASDGKNLYVADSESNIIRAIDTARGHVQTLAGGDLFEFGDRDGRGDDVRFQHPLGIHYYEGLLYVADTYNHKIKTLNPLTGEAKTFAGTGKPGQTDGARASFYEPGGLSIADGKLYVADTNNHAVRVIDLRTRIASTLKIEGLQPPAERKPIDESDADSDGGPEAQELTVAPQRLKSGVDARLVAEVVLPEGYHLNPSAPHRYKLTVEEGKEHLAVVASGTDKEKAYGPELSMTAKDLRLPLSLSLQTRKPGEGLLRLRLTLYYCREDNTGTCRIRTLDWRARVAVVEDTTAPQEIRLRGEVRE